tara:strand:+ start:255 stop:1160 length:906 start_codon:yes stop_codon:yes gene_type:complete
MAKKDDITLIIAKSFAKERFTKEETEISKKLTIAELVTDHGLNDIQSKEVMKWCAISCASLPLESEVLEENFFGNIFRRNKKKTNRSQQEIDSLVKHQIELSSSFDDNILCSFLNKVNNFKSKIESEGLHRVAQSPTRKADDYDAMIDMAIDKKDFSHNKVISPSYLKGLRQLLNKTKSLYIALDNMQLPRSAKNEMFALSSKDLDRREPRTKKQISDLIHLVDNPMYKNAIGKPSDHIKRQVLVKEFIKFMNDLINPSSNKEKISVILAAKKYIRELHNEIFKIVKSESSLNVHSHAVSS